MSGTHTESELDAARYLLPNKEGDGVLKPRLPGDERKTQTNAGPRLG